MLVRDRMKPRAAVLLAVPAMVLAACGGGTTTSSGSGSGASASPTVASATADAAAKALVPAAIASKGTLNVASDATYSPDEFIGPDGTTVVGMDPDLITAIAQVLGLQVKVVNATFDSIIPGLASGKYDVGISSFSLTLAREMTVDFVTYYSVGEGFLVKASGGPNVQTLADLCGHTVGVESGTTEQTDATAQDTMCKGSGKQGVTVSTFPDQNSVNLALSSGRTDVDFLDSQIAAYQASISNGQFKVVGQSVNAAPYGIAFPKGNGMAPAVLAAVKDLIASGIYTQILNKWGIAAGAITSPMINGATS
jgi:polar amino acid transport system substrate-binding protein